MQPDEPPHKKVRLSRNDPADEAVQVVEELSEARRRLAIADVLVPRAGNSACVSTSHSQQHSEAMQSDQDKFTVFVFDTQSRLFAAEVAGSQQLWNIVEGLAGRGCQGVEPGTLLHCRGQIQQDVQLTAAQAGLKEGYTISLAPAGCTQRWEAFAEMETAFFKLHDAYQCFKSGDNGPSAGLSQELCHCCKAAGQAQTSFRTAGDQSGASRDKLLSYIQADCIPVLSCMASLPGVVMPATDCRRTELEEIHWAAYSKLVSIEGYASSAMHIIRDQKDSKLFPWVFWVLLQLTVAQVQLRQNHAELAAFREVQLFAEKCLWMNTPWSPWSELLPSTLFDASAQHYAVTQLAKCVTTATQVITQALVELRFQVTCHYPLETQPDFNLAGLELCASFSTLVELFLALHHMLLDTKGAEVTNMVDSFVDMLLKLTQTVKAVERFGATCIRLGIAPDNTARDPYTGEPLPDPSSNPYASAIPTVLRENLAGLFPGIHALCSSNFGKERIPFLSQQVGLPGSLSTPEYLRQFLKQPVPSATLKADDLKPGGVMHRAVTASPAEGQELQEQLPEQLRKQYLHKLFPDLSVEANYDEDVESQELVIARDELLGERLRNGNRSMHTEYTRGLNITFQGELGQGSGVMKEWLGLLAKHQFGSYRDIFQPCPGDPATVHPTRAMGPEHGAGDAPGLMRNAGKFAGLALCYRCPIGIKLSTACLKMMTGRQVCLADFEEVDPEMCRTTRAIQAATAEELQAMSLTFETPQGMAFEHQGDEAVGAAVTLHNKQRFLDCLFHHFLDCSEEVSHFLEGLCSMSDWHSWNESDAEDWVTDRTKMLRPLVIDDFSKHLAGKLAPLDVAEWRAATTVQECLAFHQDMEWFWQMVSDMDDERRCQLLSFWTSMSTVPAGGFTELSSKLKLQASSEAHLLPTAHTCFFQLNLPHYNSLEDMKSAFATAMDESQGFAFG